MKATRQQPIQLTDEHTKIFNDMFNKPIYRMIPKEPDLFLKDEGDMTTVCFMTDKAQLVLKSDPTYNDLKDRVYGDKVLKIDILNESGRGMIAWAVSHGLTIDNG